MELDTPTIKRGYEAIIIMHPDASSEEQKALFKKNNEIIKGFAGSVNHVDTWGSRRLANEINKIPMGIYFHTTFTADPKCVLELERTMKINDRVLRAVHVKLDDKKTVAEHLENFRDLITASVEREKERGAKAQAYGSRSPRRPSTPFAETKSQEPKESEES